MTTLDPPRHFDRLPPDHRQPLPALRRAEPDRLKREIDSISRSPVVTAVLEVADAALLVLNPERQIVGFNSRLRELRGPEDVLGRRAGEALGCVNARGPGGCGSLPACETCGALGAILGCQARDRPVESECLIRTDRADRALELNVRATPVRVEGAPFTVVSLRDISSEKRREVLEQVFFHDVLNTIGGLQGWARLLQRGGDVAKASDRLVFLSDHVAQEIRDHRSLLLAESGRLLPEELPLRANDLLRDVEKVSSGHSAARGRRIEVAPAPGEPELATDRSLLARVLVNMVRNALEASPEAGVVGLACDSEPDGVRFSVRNEGVIPPHVQARVFQRSFSTKGQRGRGLGTYSMKLFGERYLGGEVSFSSSPQDGTVFWIRLPRRPRGPSA
ncbi:sensor histidine kinase [Anaeromyxobacter paludicola]|uniref:histidine kinase n=1 Tax=Anaeromyxobacter paludicola TaxID=2918171 RepID=A0ABM7XDS7_9BACT|nr:ATP-binding protein [Anaeromyxobacter paludicola]BDG10021.1 sensor histidine kinase [Anaeromyxobacter paludicola]